MFCPHCSTDVGSADQYCMGCGARLVSSQATPLPGQHLRGASSAAALVAAEAAPRRLRLVLLLLLDAVLLTASAILVYTLLLRHYPPEKGQLVLGDPRLVRGAVPPRASDRPAEPVPAVPDAGRLGRPHGRPTASPPRPRPPLTSVRPDSARASVGGADARIAPPSDPAPVEAGVVALLDLAAPAGPSGDGVAAAPPVEEASALDEESVRMVVRHYLPQVRACYDRALKQQERIAGTVEVKFEITAAGTVGSAAVHRDTTGHAGLGRCIAAALQGWRFPRPVGGNVVFIYPFVFSMGG